MDILHRVSAGTLQSNDCLIEVSPSDDFALEIESPVFDRFGTQIESVVRGEVKALSVETAAIKVTDRGALDCTIRARVRTALLRAAGETL